MGRIVKPAPFQSRLTPGTVARVEPNRRWFGEYCSSETVVDVDISQQNIRNTLIISVVYWTVAFSKHSCFIISHLLFEWLNSQFESCS